jgi:hypothetical protein
MKRTLLLSAAMLFAFSGTLESQGRGNQVLQLDPQVERALRRVFLIRGARFPEKQQSKIEELRREYMPTLVEVQRRERNVITDQQRRELVAAIKAARDAGKVGSEFRAAVNAAFVLTQQQEDALAEIRRNRAEPTAQVQGELREMLTDEHPMATWRRESATRKSSS